MQEGNSSNKSGGNLFIVEGEGTVSQNRFKSPVFIASLVAQVLSILVFTEVIDTGIQDAVEQVVAGILQLLVCFGLMNNPTDKKSF